MVISRPPSLLPSYAKALFKGHSFKEGDVLPALHYSFEGVTFPLDKIAAYCKACRLEETDYVPLFFPHSHMGPLHLAMMTHESFPLKTMGAVHVRNHLVQLAPLSSKETYQADLKIVGQRRRPAGLEFDLETLITLDGKLLWSSISTYLVRMKFKGEDAKNRLSDAALNLDAKRELTSFEVPRSVGKEFGMVTGDINPIHMSKVLAKLFGFKKDLAHGMWSIGRGLSFFDHVDFLKPVRFDVAFKGPLYLGEMASVFCHPKDQGLFEFYGAGNDRPSIVGWVRNVDAEETL